MRTVLKHYFVPHAGNDYHPHFFRNTVIGFISILVISLLSLSLIGSFTLKNKNLLGAIYTSVLVDLTNKDRDAALLPTLSINPVLEKAAELKATDMAEKSYFAHISPDGLSPWHWISKAGYVFIFAGENLAVNFNESEAVQNAWMNSPTHRANILNNNFTEIGIAVKEGVFEGKSTLFVVQMFGKPAIVAREQKPMQVVSLPLAKEVSVETKSEVKGTDIQVISEISDDMGNNLFVAVKNPIAEIESAKNVEILGEPSNTEIKPGAQNSIWNTLVMRFPIALNVFYLVLGAIVVCAIVVLITIEMRHQHHKPLGLALILLALILGAMYANRSTDLFALASLL